MFGRAPCLNPSAPACAGVTNRHHLGSGQFLGGPPMQSPSPIATASVHLPVRLDWLDRCREEIIEPDLPIVDPHHHLVDRPETGRYLLPELLADTGSGHNITLPSTSNGCRCTARQDRSRCARSKSSSPTVSQQWRRGATTAIHGSAPASSVTPIWRSARRSRRYCRR